MIKDEETLWHQQVKEYREMIENREEENRHKSKSSLQEYEEAISYFHSLQMFAFTEHANIRSLQPHDGAISMLAFRASNDILAAWNLLLCGYFTGVNSILRSVYEACISIIYFSEFPDDAATWWKMNPKKNEEHGIYVGNMRQKLIDTEKLDSGHRDLYSVLSQMTHPNADSMYPGLERGTISGKSVIIFNVVGKFEEKKVKDFAKCICILSLNLTTCMFEAMDGIIEMSPYKTMDEFLNALDAMAQHLKLDERLLGEEPNKRYGAIHGLDEELFGS